MLKPTRGLAFVACAMTVALLGSACGSSDGTSSDGTSSKVASSQDGPAIKQARATVEELSTPREFTVEPVSGKVPAGKVVAYVNCTIPQCSPGAMNEPVKDLGWTLHPFDFDLTKGAQDYLRAVDAALESHPDYLVLNFFGSPDLVSRQLDRAKAEGIPVIGIGADLVPGVAVMLEGRALFEDDGKYMADMALADAGGPVTIATLADPTLPQFAAIVKGADDVLGKVKGSSISTINVSLGQPQATNVSAIVNYLKAHPDTKYLLFPGSAFSPGVKQGLQAAGLADKVKLILAAPFPTDLQSVKDGEWAGVLASEVNYQWRVVDAMARLAAGESIKNREPTNDFRIVTPKNASLEAFDPPNFKKAYTKAWGV